MKEGGGGRGEGLLVVKGGVVGDVAAVELCCVGSNALMGDDNACRAIFAVILEADAGRWHCLSMQLP